MPPEHRAVDPLVQGGQSSLMSAVGQTETCLTTEPWSACEWIAGTQLISHRFSWDLYGSPEISGHECALIEGRGSIAGPPIERAKLEPRRPRRASGPGCGCWQTGSRPSRRHP